MSAIRDGLVDALVVALPAEVTVYEYPSGAMLESTVAVVGVPSNVRLQGGLSGERTEDWSVAVATGRSGADDPATYQRLEQLLDAVMDLLPDALDDVARPWREASLTRVDFAAVTLPGGTRPGYLLTITVIH